MLEKALEKIGLSDMASRTYGALLERGSSSAGSLAKKLLIPRSSLYGYLNELTEVGLAKKSQKDNKIIWNPEPVEVISDLLEERIDELGSTKSKFEKVLPQVKAGLPDVATTPQLNYFEGPNELKQMLRDVLLCRDTETVAFWSIKDAMKFLGKDFMEELSARRIQNNIRVRVIWPDGKNEDMGKYPFLGSGESYLRDIRIAPADLETSMGFWVYGSKISFISSKKEAFGFIVESKELAEMLSKQFEFFWKISSAVELRKSQ